MTRGTSTSKPARVQTPFTAHYWDHADRGELLIQRCNHCGQHQFYPRQMCSHCWSQDVGWRQALGRGFIWTFTIAHQPGHPAWTEEAPYVIAIVELDEGPRMLTNIVDCDPNQVAVGQRVRLRPGARGAPSFLLA